MITYQDFAQAFSLFYGLLFLMLVGLAVSFFKPRWQRIVAVLVVTGFIAWPIMDRALEIAGKRQYTEDAWAHFNKLCMEKAGIKVYNTVEGVESVMLMKPRPTVGPDEKELYDQFWKGDQYGGITWKSLGSRILTSELLSPYEPYNSKTRNSQIQKPPLLKLVEVRTGSGNTDYPSYLAYAKLGSLKETVITKPVSRYGIDWDDISSEEDRKYWIAGSRWRVIDLQTKEFLAERIGFVIEPGFGGQGAARRPWLFAESSRTSCPPIEAQHNQAFLRTVFNTKE